MIGYQPHFGEEVRVNSAPLSHPRLRRIESVGMLAGALEGHWYWSEIYRAHKNFRCARSSIPTRFPVHFSNSLAKRTGFPARCEGTPVRQPHSGSLQSQIPNRS